MPPQRRTDLGDGLTIGRGNRIKFNVRGYKKPDKLRMTLFLGGNVVLESDIKDEIELENPEGKYVLAVKADWGRIGDVTYAFQIRISSFRI